MAGEIELLQEEILELIDNLRDLNKTVMSTVTDAFGKQAEAVKKSTKIVDEFGRAIVRDTEVTKKSTEATEKDLKAKKELTAEQKASKKALEEHREQQRISTNYAARLAKEQLEAARQSKTLSARLEALGGESVAYQKNLLKAQAMLSSLGSLSGSVSGLSKSLASGTTSFAQFGDITKSVTSILGKMLGAIPLAGEYLDKGAQAAGEAAAFIMQQVDVIAQAYTELGRVGATTAQGLDGLRNQFNEMGLVSLPAFINAVKQNTLGLAALGPTTARGSKMLSKSLGEITDPNGPFVGGLLALGYSLDEIASTSAAFATSQALYGGKQIRTTADLTKATVAYLKEITELADATGRSREQVLEERKKSEADVKFRARMQSLRDQGLGDQADEIQKLVDSVGGPLADAIRASVSGVPLTKEAQGAFALMGSSILDSISAIEKGSTAEKERLKLLQSSAGGLKDFNDTIQYIGGDVFGGDALVRQAMDMRRILEQAERTGEDPFEIAKREKEAARAAGGATETYVDATKSIANASRNLQSLAFEAVPAAVKAADIFATTLDKATNALRTILNLPKIPTRESTAGGAVGGGGTAGGGGGAVGGGGGTKAGGRAAVPVAPRAASGGAAGGGGMPPATVGGAEGIFGGAPGVIVPSQGAGMRPGAAPGTAASLGQIRELVAGVESRGDYNIVVGGEKYPLTDMTVQDVLALQKKLIASGRDSAAGKYQIKYSTLAGIMGKAGVGLTDKFDRSTQDKLADALIMGRGFNQYASNPTQESKERFLANLAREWAGLPGSPSGESYYKGVGNNKAGIGWQQALASFQTGGIASGPRSGYTALLHGNEAVVPLPDGKTIPVEMPNLDRSMEQQVGMMGAQLVALEELVRYMRENASISAKILQAAHN